MQTSPQRPPSTIAIGRGRPDDRLCRFFDAGQYSGVLSEHRAVRESAGIFDLSHMGEFRFEGPDAAANLQRLTTNDVTKLLPGQAQYTLLCNEKGGIVDDVILYRLDEDAYRMVPNAANIEKDREWIRSRLKGRVTLQDQSLEHRLYRRPRSQSLGDRLGRARTGPFRHRFVSLRMGSV